MIIYKATNIINGKVYIGQTIGKLQSRKIVHESEAKRHKRNHHFHNALNYHGKNNFIWEVIDESETIDELNEKEIYWISKYNSTNKLLGYNRDLGGLNGFHSEISKKKISIANTGRVFSDENKRHISEQKKGKK